MMRRELFIFSGSIFLGPIFLGFILLWLPWSISIAQNAVPATADHAASSASLPVMFEGAVRFRWRIP